MSDHRNVIVSLKGVGCKSGQRNLLHGINWEIAEGENWIVFGMNGSGKTTLLSIIAGFRGHTQGEMTVFGQPYSNENVLELRRQIGWVSSSFFEQYYTKESVLDIVLSGAVGTLSTGWTIDDAILIEAKRLLFKFQVLDKIYQPFQRLSKGEKGRVLLARALINQPKLLLFDEPATGLDLVAREKLLEMVKDIALDEKLTIIYVTHHVEEVPAVFQKCLLLKNGRAVSSLSIEQAFSSQILSDFIEYPINIRSNNERFFVSAIGGSIKEAYR